MQLDGEGLSLQMMMRVVLDQSYFTVGAGDGFWILLTAGSNVQFKWVGVDLQYRVVDKRNHYEREFDQ